MRKCSFCGKSERQVRLIAGPDVQICAECVALCVEVLEHPDAPAEPGAVYVVPDAEG